MKGKTVLITGATSGIGFHTASALASKGARVLLTGRDEARGREAVDRLRLEAGHDRVAFLAVDHSTVGGNRDLAERVLERADHLEVLINNVGAIHARRLETGDGYEATLATNFLAPFVLTDILMPLLLESAPARVVNVVSSAYSMWKRDPFEDLAAKERYVGIEAYAHSKLLNLLWTFALARRLEGSGVVANAANPGMAWTNQTRAMTPETVPAWRLFWPLVRLVQRRASPEAAAKSSVYLASSEEASRVSGSYFESNAKPKRPSELVLDVGNQERAWDLAKTLVARAPTGESPEAGRRTKR
jgi:NAD(P)-dependent dehydrogenase (short-subunit alcohol dehydrogenase family)